MAATLREMAEAGIPSLTGQISVSESKVLLFLVLVFLILVLAEIMGQHLFCHHFIAAHENIHLEENISLPEIDW